ncbi:MAG: CatB-related O-acetyltransferase [Selenomonadaceae bacterium]|nr:CatB-related O-acetyltransferase [Selenomonadaceae bacterium]
MKVLYWNIDGLFADLKPIYEKYFAEHMITVAGYIAHEGGTIVVHSYKTDKSEIQVDYVIVSSKHYYTQQKIAQATLHIPADRIIDGRIFSTPGFSLPYYLQHHIVLGHIPQENFSFSDLSGVDIPRMYDGGASAIKLGRKSYVTKADILGFGLVEIGAFSSLGQNLTLEMGLNNYHDYHRVFTYDTNWFDWETDYPQKCTCPAISIGSDVWLGVGVKIKVSGRSQKRTIGDGAVIAADSVVVSDIPPYAIAGGNPAKVIKYRFSPAVISSLQKIKWWEWTADEIYQRMHLLDQPERLLDWYQQQVKE